MIDVAAALLALAAVTAAFVAGYFAGNANRTYTNAENYLDGFRHGREWGWAPPRRPRDK